MPYHQLLMIMDQYPCRLEKKGGFVEFAAKDLIFTSTTPPSHWYTFDEKKLVWKAFERRVDKWILFTGFKEYYETDNYVDFINMYDKHYPTLL